MQVQILNDSSGNPTHAILLFDEWKKIVDLLSKLDSNKDGHEIKEDVGGLEWYVATETFNSVVNGLIAHYNRELMNLKKEMQTDNYRIHCRKMLNELQEVNDDLSITDSLEKMQEYIGKYAPMMKKINTAA